MLGNAGTCRTCLHWDSDGDPKGYGTCGRIDHVSLVKYVPDKDGYAGPGCDVDPVWKEENPALVCDASGYHAMVHTTSEFACCLWEARDAC